MTFAYPYMLAMPLVIVVLRLIQRRSPNAILYPSTSFIGKVSPGWKVQLRGPLLGVLGLAALVFLSIAAARPQRASVLAEIEKSRNIMLALDISGSMRTRDFQSGYSTLNRLEAVKFVVSQYLKSREQDRIGLVVFGSKAFLQSPLTKDHQLLSQLLEGLEVGLAGDGTAIGDGLGLALKRIADLPGDSKAVILLTDGVTTQGINPIQAAQVAKDLKIKVHTIGIGSGDTAGRMGSAAFLQGGLKQFEFDEATLRKIAELTGGVYFNAENLEGLMGVYREIDKLERTDSAKQARKLIEELFVPYAFAALVAYLAYLLFAHSIFMKLP